MDISTFCNSKLENNCLRDWDVTVKWGEKLPPLSGVKSSVWISVMKMARVISIDEGKLLQGSWESWVNLESVGPIMSLSLHCVVITLWYASPAASLMSCLHLISEVLWKIKEGTCLTFAIKYTRRSTICPGTIVAVGHRVLDALGLKVKHGWAIVRVHCSGGKRLESSFQIWFGAIKSVRCYGMVRFLFHHTNTPCYCSVEGSQLVVWFGEVLEPLGDKAYLEKYFIGIFEGFALWRDKSCL